MSRRVLMAKSIADTFLHSLQSEYETLVPHTPDIVIAVLDSNTNTFIARCGGGIVVASREGGTTSVTTKSADLHKLVSSVLKGLK